MYVILDYLVQYLKKIKYKVYEPLEIVCTNKQIDHSGIVYLHPCMR